MNIKQFVWVAFWSTSAIFVVTLLMTGFRSLQAEPEFLGIVAFFVMVIVVTIYRYLGT